MHQEASENVDTVIENLQNMADGIAQGFQTLLLEYSSVYEWNPGNSDVLIFDASGHFAFRDLPVEGKQLQSKLLEEYKRFNSLAMSLLREQPTRALKKVEDANASILRIIEQRKTWCKTEQEALDKAMGALNEQIEVLSNLYDSSPDSIVLVPDTNALLHQPILENWAFDEFEHFEIALTPTILSELDALKVNHRNESVREKARKLIEQLKEFRRRGKLTEGVPLVRDVSSIYADATEPRMEESLPWLDPTNNDDRFLASVLEVMRVRPRSSVYVVSRDINLQNKAEFACLPIVEAPEPDSA